MPPSEADNSSPTATTTPSPGVFTGDVAAQDQALEWLGRLRASDVTAQEEADFAAWLAASSQHKRAFDEALELWELSAAIPAPVIPNRTRYRPWVPLAAAASLLLACVFWLGQFSLATLSTDKGEQRRVILQDGSVAYLNTASTIEVDYSAGQRRIRLLSGEVWFDVAKDVERPFVVTGNYATATAIGTAFVVRDTPGFTQISVTEGVVSVEIQRLTKKIENQFY